LLFVWFVVALTPAICEEAVFRGVAQRAFERGLRQRWAMVLTAVTFAFFHLYPTQFVPLTAIGLFLSVIVWRGNSLYLGVIGHLANNSFAVLTMYFSGNSDGSQDIAVGPGGLASAGITLAALAALAMFVALFWKLTRPSTFLTPSDAR
jgi:membrane protease YdiL (CAAX protease family)